MKREHNHPHTTAPDSIIDVRQATTELGDRSYLASLDDANALARDELKQITVDVPTAVGAIEAAYPSVYALRAELVALPGFPHAALDTLPQWTLAFGNADARYAAATTPPGALGPFVTEGTALRDQLFTQAESFAKFNLFDAAQVAAMISGQSHRAIGRDLQTLARAYRDHWTALEGKSPVTEAQLARAMFLGEQITALVAFKDQLPAQTSAAAEMRRRMFTLVDTAWDEIRRGLTYLRWHEGDLDQLAPSIHAQANAGRRADPQPNAPSTPASPAQPAAAAAVPASLVASGAVHTVPQSNPFRE